MELGSLATKAIDSYQFLSHSLFCASMWQQKKKTDLNNENRREHYYIITYACESTKEEGTHAHGIADAIQYSHCLLLLYRHIYVYVWKGTEKAGNDTTNKEVFGKLTSPAWRYVLSAQIHKIEKLRRNKDFIVNNLVKLATDMPGRKVNLLSRTVKFEWLEDIAKKSRILGTLLENVTIFYVIVCPRS